MKRHMMILVLLCAAASILVNAQEQVATISPSNPKIGDEIAISYNSKTKAATLRDVKELTAELLVYRDPDPPLLIEVPMKQSRAVWRGSFKLEEPKSQLLLLRFVSGEQKDDNGENVWDFLVYGKAGKPVKGAYVQRGLMLQYGGFRPFFKREKNIEKAKDSFTNEKEQYPENWRAYTALWDIWLKEKNDDETKAKVKAELDRLYELYKNDQDVAVWFLRYFEQTDQKERADQIREEMIKADPKGRLAHNKQRDAIYREQDPAKRAEMAEQFLQDFPQTGHELNSLQSVLAASWIQSDQYDKAFALLEKMPNPDAILYNMAASKLIEKGERLDVAVAWAKKGVDLLRNPDPATKPSFLLSAAQVKSYVVDRLGMLLETYASGFHKLGRTAEALAHFEEAYTLSKGDNANINERLVESYVANGKYDRAMEVAAECIKKGKSNDNLLAHYKAAYTKAKGSEQGFDETLKEVRDIAKNEMRKKLLKDRVNKPVVDFALKTLDGKITKLSDLKGKVVVVDFWATWCGPCKASFPYLQKVYEKYKDNPNVVILAVNSWEGAKNEEERIKTVQKFIEENKYTFSVLLDENDKIIGKYGVEGIPTKFVIDKRGMIQFRDIGFSGGQEMMDKMDLQFEMLLSDEFYSSTQ